MTHTRIVPVAGILLAFALVAAPVIAQQQPAPPSQPPQQQLPQEQVARGELESVDPQARMLTIKPTEGAVQRFQFTENTRITGARDAAGLATMSGRQVVVYYLAQGSDRVATEIEVQSERER